MRPRGQRRYLEDNAGLDGARETRIWGWKMAGTEQRSGFDAANEEAITAWDGPLFDRFLRFQPLIEGGFAAHGEAAMKRLAPQPGQRVLDIGCGFGDTTRALAGLVAPGGTAVGLDAAPRFIEHAREAAAEAGVDNASFAVADIQTLEPGEPFDKAFSRFGTMFFANPVAAMRNVRQSLVPGGQLAMVVWRQREDNEWLYRAQRIVEEIVSRPEEYDEPTCGPGPFSMANADTTSDVMQRAGFEDVALHRSDLPMTMGSDIDEAIEIVMALGPAGEILRLQGERAAHLHGRVDEALREGMADMATADGITAMSSTWIVTARVPEA
jgi:ubiquinone/menaquinone biosynthesis C-methylase UbiE